jgi:hypothetical protein
MAAGIISFLGAFLLFFLQPFSAKTLIPWFGGGSQVWLTCMLFFQAMLLAGYGYAHLLLTRAPARLQVRIHALVLALALASLGWTWAASGRPLLPPYRWALGAEAFPPLGILRVLLGSLACCVLPLAASSPLAQAWHLRAGGGSPYRLYALSNAGSMLGLLAYPFLVEPFLPLSVQAWAAAGLFLAYFAAMAVLAWRAAGAEAPVREHRAGARRGRELSGWIFTAMAGTLLLMAVTNVATTELSGLPLLWVLPLAVYLATFILAFDGRLELEGGRFQALAMALFLLALALVPAALRAPGLVWTTCLLMVALSAGCLFVHGRLYALRPPPERLSGFYLAIALGGVLGGAVVGVAAPLLFNRMWELPLAVAMVGAVAFLGRREGPPLRWVRLASALGCLVLAARAVVAEVRSPDRSYRDFYGQVRVATLAQGNLKVMLHGRTLHGLELMDQPRRPLAYYQPSSGIARAIASVRRRHPALRLGVIGLGVGDVLAHAQAGDRVRIYEISPKVLRLSGPGGTEFSMAGNCPAQCDFLAGDGRLLLAREPAQGFDLLLADAFSGGNIPVSLLTLEALDGYFRNLAPGGLLVLNATNRLPVDLVVLAGAKARGLGALEIDAPGPENPAPLGPLDRWSRFLVLGRDPGTLLDPDLVEAARAVVLPPLPAGAVVRGTPEFQRRVREGERLASAIRPWTDDRNSLGRLAALSLWH